jgi:hypothetical protein
LSRSPSRASWRASARRSRGPERTDGTWSRRWW